MIKEYTNGESFIKENEEFLNTNKYLAAFFFIDSKVLDKTSKKNYALKSSIDDKTLLSIKVEPYSLLLFGDKECLSEMMMYIKTNGFEFDSVLCATDVGDYLSEISYDLLNLKIVKHIGMDFMEAEKITEESSNDVEIPNSYDVDEIFDNLKNFFKDCKLPDKPNKESIMKEIDSYRVIKVDNKIVSMAKMNSDTDKSMKIAFVYTKPEYRDKKYARKVVCTLKNEIISKNKIATLNVDQDNPISYHLYTSLGFHKIFSQGVYVIQK